MDSSEWNGQPSYHSFGGAPPTPHTVQPSSVSSSVGAPAVAVTQPYLHESLYDSSPIISSLPPMSSFRAQSGPSVVHSSVSPSSAYPPPTSGSSPSLAHQSQSSAAADTIGKALVSIYSGSAAAGAEHTPSTYSGSASSTPVSSPQTWPQRLATNNSSATFANTSDANDAHLHTLVSDYH